MLLSWSDRTGIAEALHQAYPETDRLALGVDDLVRLIDGLPQKPSTPPPSEKFLQSVLWTWMCISDEAGGQTA